MGVEETKGRRKGGGGGEERGGVSDAISNTFLLTNILHLQGPQHSLKRPHSHTLIRAILLSLKATVLFLRVILLYERPQIIIFLILGPQNRINGHSILVFRATFSRSLYNPRERERVSEYVSSFPLIWWEMQRRKENCSEKWEKKVLAAREKFRFFFSLPPSRQKYFPLNQKKKVNERDRWQGGKKSDGWKRKWK